jgi:hypothetical protein
MKKTLFFFIITLLVTIYGINAYAENPLKLFYKEKLINLSQEIITQGNEYFINAKELSAVTGKKLKIDPSNKSLTLTLDNNVKYYEINSYDYNIIDPSTVTHDLPELIDDKVYFPFSFIMKEYDVIVNYDKKANIVYFFPKDNSLKSFTNTQYKYTLNIPDNFHLSLDESYDKFDSSSILLVNSDNSFSASIVCDPVNKTVLKNMRFLLSDYTSSDKFIFDRIVDYKKSYFRSLLDSYKNDFLFGNMDSTLSESNIKIIKDYNEDFFGENSNVILFNTITSQKFTSKEDINLIISIPSYENEMLYSLCFILEKGALNDSNLNIILQFIKGLAIENLPPQEELPEVLRNITSVSAANLGIYPLLSSSEIQYNVLRDELNFYSIKYPSNYVPYLHNNFIDDNGYRSYKINSNNYFSISCEHLQENLDAILEKIDTIKSYYNDKIKVVSTETRRINGKKFTMFNYEKENNNTKEFVTDYFIVNDLRLYTIELSSLVLKPSQNILDEFNKIVESFEFITPESNNTVDNTSFVEFLNDGEEYSISYPDDWSVQDVSQDINYDTIAITSPSYSGPLNIVINEAEYRSNLTASELLRYTTNYDSSGLNKYFKNYITPYTNKKFKVLKSSVKTDANTTMIYKLVNYLDEGDRYKVCYSIDLIKNNKIFSLYISASEYLFEDGVLTDKNLSYILDYMCNSFRATDAKEYMTSFSSSKKRNSKIEFIENFFKKAWGESTTVTFAKNLSSEKDVLVYISNCNKDGAYRLYFDYNNRKITISKRALNSEIAYYAEKKMKNNLKGKFIKDISVNCDDMTISVEYSNTEQSAPIYKTYYLLVTPSSKDLAIDFVRKFNYDSIKAECQNYLENYLLTDVKITFPQNYSYSNENMTKYFYEKCIVPVYAEFDGQSGYFYLEIDPVSNSTKILKCLSTYDIKESIEAYFSLKDLNSEVLEYKTDKSDKFCFIVSVSSKNNKPSRQVIHMYFDENSQDIDFSSRDFYFSGGYTE